MSCVDHDFQDRGTKSLSKKLASSKKRNDALAKMLCALLVRLEGRGVDKYIEADPDLVKWKKDHEKSDLQRKEARTRRKLGKKASRDLRRGRELAKRLLPEAYQHFIR